MSTRTASLGVLVFLAWVLPADCQVIRIVDDDGLGSSVSCDDGAPAFATIGSAIAASADGDTVLVCPGIYAEHIDFSGKAITVQSTHGSTLTIIDGSASDTVVTFANGESNAAVLEGFTIRNGRSGFDTPGFGHGGG